MKIISIALFILIGFYSCKEEHRDKFSDHKPPLDATELLIEMQKNEVKRDSIYIERFIQEHGLELKSTGTGLKYQILKTTDLEQISSGSRVIFEYTMMSLKGDTLYSSDKSGYIDMMVDYSQAETGIHELLKLMNYGEEARAIIPFHLAHGFAGDDYKIPPFTSLVIELKVLL